MEVSMKFKNIFQIAALMGIIATGSAHAMQAVLKAAMRWTGNAIGVGLPLTTPAIGTAQLVKGRKNIVDKRPDNFRNPTALEQEFLNKYVTSKNAVVKIHKIDAVDQSFTCAGDGKYVITVPENYSSIDNDKKIPVSLEDAIKTNNQDVLSRCAAILQHKNAHKQQHYYDKISASPIVLPLVTTGAVAGYMRSFKPYNKTASLTRHALGMCGKSLGGYALMLGNGLIGRKILRNFEYDADQEISHEHRKNYAQDLQEHNATLKEQVDMGAFAIGKLIEMGLQPDPKFTEQWAELAMEKITSPPVEERVKRLEQPEPTNFIEKIQRELKKI
jgi:hypothetical protein